MNTNQHQTTETEQFDSPLEKMDNSLRSIFNTAPIDVEPKNELAPVVISNNEETSEDEKVKADADFIRSNLYAIIQNGQDALNYAVELAKQSDSPKAFESVAALVKSLAEVNLQMLDAHEKKRKLTSKKQIEEQPTKIVNNSIVFNGSTSELNKMLSNMRKEQ